MNEENTIICVVCCQRVSSNHKKWIFAIGKCDHWVCFECSTRMRVLCKQNECPICRQQLDEVVFTRYKNKKFEDFDLKKCLYRNDYGIYFEDEESLEAYGKLLEHPCRKCRNRPPFKTLNDLSTHLRKEHELFLCDLCVSNLKSFTHERKYYTRKELVRHRKSGDPDETSHRGHPICTFCDERYVDDEDLHLHLRREHFYCHFCDPSGFSHFYGDYSALKEHFISDHYLCKECDSQEEKFTNAFRSEIDLQVHIAQFHSQNMSKSDLKKAKTLSLDLFIRQRSGHLDNGQQTKKQIKKEMRRNHQKDNNTDDSDLDNEEPAPISTQPPRPEDFPSLCANTASVSTAVTSKQNDSKATKPNKKANSYSVYLSKNPKINTTNDDEFPALPGGSCGVAFSASDAISYNKLAKQKSSNVAKPQQNVRKNINLIDSSVMNSPPNVKKQNKQLVINREEFPSLPVSKKKNRPMGQSSSYVNNNLMNKTETTIEWSASPQTESKTIATNESKGKNSVPNSALNSLKPLTNFVEFPSLEVNKKKATGNSVTAKPLLKPVSRPTATNPPPGLTSVKKKNSNLSLSSVAQQVINTSSDNSQSLDSECFNSNEFCYLNPIDFNERNQSLVRKVEEVLSDRSKFLLFKEASQQFRQSMITGEQYFQKCIDLFGRNKFWTIFSELLVLLPDITKQNELLRAQQMELKNTKGAIPKGSKLLNDCNSDEFIICSKCRQVLITKDQSHHMSAHLQ